MKQWVPVLDYENHYEVSNTGDIRRINPFGGARVGKVLKTYKNKMGYMTVRLSKNAVSRPHRVHVIVCEAFHGKRPEGCVVLHGDGNKLNNEESNLRWGTSSENRFDSVNHGTHPFAGKTHCPVGHEYTEENTRVYRGSRSCRTCKQDRDKLASDLMKWYIHMRETGVEVDLDF